MDVKTLSDDEIRAFLVLLSPNHEAMVRAMEWVEEHDQTSTQQVLRDLEGAGRIQKRRVKTFPKWEVVTA